MSHRSARKRRKHSKNGFKKYFLIAFLFGFFGLFLGFYSFYKQFSQSYISADSVGAEDFKDQDFYAIVLVGASETFGKEPFLIEKVKLLLVSKSSTSFLVYDIPTNTIIDMPGKYGEEELRSTFILGSLSSVDSANSCADECFNEGLAYIKLAVQKLAGVRIDRVAVVEPELYDFIEKLFVNAEAIRILDVAKVKCLRDSMKTDFRFSDFLHFYTVVRGFSPTDIKHKSFTRTDEIDSSIKQISYNSRIAKEKSSIAILNGVRMPGVASQAARAVQNLGGFVVSVDNSMDPSERTYLIASDPNSQTAKYIAGYWGLREVYSKSDLDLDEPVLDRADIVLILGLDNISKY